MNLQGKLSQLRSFFDTGNTLTYDWRIAQLKSLLHMLDVEEDSMVQALNQDLHKSPQESWLTEIGFVKMELELAIRKLKKWMSKERLPTPLALKPARSYVQSMPRGLVLIISPWNYPLQLSLGPLVAAIGAGNVCVLKPSEYSPASSQWLRERLPKYLDERSFLIYEGGPEETQELLNNPFDSIFFTGSSATAKHIAAAAAKHLTPLTLELGGKSPCLVWECKDHNVAAKRIVWGKFTNAGQTCVAPDYLLVRSSEKEALIRALITNTKALFGENPKQSKDYGRIINERHFTRLSQMLDDGERILGGSCDRETKFIEPTILSDIKGSSPLLSEEIFGPILPIISIDTKEEAFEIIARNPYPLASYLFSEDEGLQKHFIEKLHTGGLCINDCLTHLANIHLPFGGVGQSGIGQSHGKHAFDTFSHKKAVLHNSTRFDISLRYPPYHESSMKWLKRFM